MDCNYSQKNLTSERMTSPERDFYHRFNSSDNLNLQQCQKVLIRLYNTKKKLQSANQVNTELNLKLEKILKLQNQTQITNIQLENNNKQLEAYLNEEKLMNNASKEEINKSNYEISHLKKENQYAKLQLANNINQQKGETAKLNKELETLQTINKKLQKEIQFLNENLESVSEKYQKNQQQIVKGEMNNRFNEEKIEKLSVELKKLGDEANQEKRLANQLQLQLNDKEKFVDQLKSKYKQLKQNYNRAQAEMEDGQTQDLLQKLRSKYEKIKNKKKYAILRLEEQIKINEQLCAENLELKSQMKQVISQNQLLKHEKQEIIQTSQTTELQIQELLICLQEKENQCKYYYEINLQNQQIIEQSKKNLEKIESQLVQSKQQALKYQNEFNILQDKNLEITKELNLHSNVINKLESQHSQLVLSQNCTLQEFENQIENLTRKFQEIQTQNMQFQQKEMDSKKQLQEQANLILRMKKQLKLQKGVNFDLSGQVEKLNSKIDQIVNEKTLELTVRMTDTKNSSIGRKSLFEDD